MSDGLDTILAAFPDTPERTIQLEMVGREVVRAAALYADEATRPDAEALFKGWSEMPGESLRKAIASHFLDRARSIVRTGSVTGNGPKLGAVHPMLARLRQRKTGAPRPGAVTGPAPGVKNIGVAKSTPDVHPMIQKLRKAEKPAEEASGLGVVRGAAAGAAIGAGVAAVRHARGMRNIRRADPALHRELSGNRKFGALVGKHIGKKGLVGAALGVGAGLLWRRKAATSSAPEAASSPPPVAAVAKPRSRVKSQVRSEAARKRTQAESMKFMTGSRWPL